MKKQDSKKVREIRLEKILSVDDKEVLGVWPKREDVDEIIHEDVDVYLPSGELAISFRVGALKSTTPVEKGGTLTKERLDYWRWVSKALSTDQRGNAAGRDIVTNPEIRLTVGQNEFFKSAIRGKVTSVEEARAIIDSNVNPSRITYYVNKVGKAGLVDLEEVEKWDKIVRQKTKHTIEEIKEATAHRNKAKLAWFDKWFERDWVPAENKALAAKQGKKDFITSQPRSNRCLSNVVGAIDRSGRIPYGRLTKSTTDRYEEFASNKDFFQEVNNLLKESNIEKFEILNERFSRVKDSKYNLFGTAFTTITVNNNFQVAYHRDGNNAENAVAVLAVMETGKWKGGEFVFPELRLGFDIREGDVFVGDNQGLIHGMLPFDFQSTDAENIMFVFYQRDRIVMLDDLACEECRKKFLEYSAANLKEKGTGEPKWAGSFEGMWTSPEWIEFKSKQLDPTDPKGKGTLERCSNTNYWCT